MKTEISRMIMLSYELEGMLLVAQQRCPDIPADVSARICDIAATLADKSQVFAKSCCASVCEGAPTVEEVDLHAPESVVPEPTADDVVIKLDEKLARNNSRNLRQAFSLNDHYRFRRELFGNSDAAFNDALHIVEAMHDIDEACEYFYDELQWDEENPEVVDFMEIINKHFLSR